MGEGKRVRAKQVGKHELEKDWELSNYIPEVGEAVYYDPEIDEDGNPDASKAVEGRAPITHTRQKIGDGINRVADLPFVGSGNTNLLSNDINSVIQTGNSAYDKNSVVLGNDNQSYAEHAFIEGSLNLSGVRLIDGFTLDITSAAIWTDENGTRYTKIVLNTLPDNLDFIEDPAIVIFANDNYYSCRFFKIEDNTLYFANHNAAGAIKTNITNNLVDQIIFYRINNDTISEECHTEHVEGAYNISGQGERDDAASKSSHLEGHTNINLGPYNHLEGVTNKILNKTQFSHVQGRGNKVDAQDKTITSLHVEGEGNSVVGASSYTHVGGYHQVVSNSRSSDINGANNEVNNTTHSVVGGYNNDITDVTSAVVIGEGLQASGENNRVVLGKYNIKNEDALVSVGGGSTSKRKTVFEIDKEGELSYYKKGTGLVKLDSELDSIVTNANNAIKKVSDDSEEARQKIVNDFEKEHIVINNSIKDLDYKVELNDKKFIKTTNLGENINYYIPDGDLLIFSQLNNIKQINYCSKNVFNKDYYRTYSSSITTNTGVSLTASKDDGKITIYGEWFAGNAQLELYGTNAGKDRVYFEPGVTYKFGRVSNEAGIEFRLVYKENGITRTIKAQSKEIAEAEFTWNKNCELNYILVRAQNNFSRAEADPAYVYPYIYIKGREPEIWVQNEFSTIDTNNITYLNTEDYGYLSFIKTDNSSSSLAEFDVYNTKNYAEQEWVNEQITGELEKTEEAITKAANEYTNTQLLKVEKSINTSLQETKEYIDQALEDFEIGNVEITPEKFTGILPIDKGGTGVDNPEALKQFLSIPQIKEQLTYLMSFVGSTDLVFRFNAKNGGFDVTGPIGLDPYESKTFTIPEYRFDIPVIGIGGFENYQYISLRNWPTTIKYIYAKGFYNSGIDVPENLYNVQSIDDSAFEHCLMDHWPKMPFINHIGSHAFSEIRSIAPLSIELPSTITSLGSQIISWDQIKDIYYDVKSLEPKEGVSSFENTRSTILNANWIDISIGKNTQSISQGVFNHTNSFLNNYINDIIFTPQSNCSTIGYKAFANTSIERLQIPKSVTKIDLEAFYNSNIDRVYYEGTAEEWEKNGFQYCDGLYEATKIFNATMGPMD